MSEPNNETGKTEAHSLLGKIFHLGNKRVDAEKLDYQKEAERLKAEEELAVFKFKHPHGVKNDTP